MNVICPLYQQMATDFNETEVFTLSRLTHSIAARNESIDNRLIISQPVLFSAVGILNNLIYPIHLRRLKKFNIDSHLN